MMILSAIIDLIVIARSDSDDPSTLAAQATPGWESAEARRAKAEAIQLSCRGEAGLLRGACHRARIRATRWLAMTVGEIDSTSIHHALGCEVTPRRASF